MLKWALTFLLAFNLSMEICAEEPDSILWQIQENRNHPEVLAEIFPIVKCSFVPTKYERLLTTQLRSVETSTARFRELAEKIGGLLAAKVMECLPTRNIEVQTPVALCDGEELVGVVELVSVMRSGDVLLEAFMKHFPDANVSKFLIQRDEGTAEPHFKYVKDSSTLSSGNCVVIAEPMIASGGTLSMVIRMLKERGVKEENIIIASVCVAPEGLIRLKEEFPTIQVVMTTLDLGLNEKKYIVPGLGDFGDRFFGTH